MRGAGVGRLHVLYRPQESLGEQRARRMSQTCRVLYDGLIAIFVRKPLAHLDNRPAVWNRAPNTWMAYRAHAFKHELRPGAWMGQIRLHYKDWFRNPSSLAASVCPRPMIAVGACACAGSWSGGFSSSVIAQGDCRLYGVAQDVLEGWLCGLIGSETGFGVVFPSALAAKRVSVQSERSVGASCPAPKGFEAAGARICY